MTVQIDGVAGDGEAGENDKVSTDVEHLIGGNAGDTLRSLDGDTTPNVFSGGPGNDTLDGGGGIDTLNGEAGARHARRRALARHAERRPEVDTADYSSRTAAVTADLAGN